MKDQVDEVTFVKLKTSVLENTIEKLRKISFWMEDDFYNLKIKLLRKMQNVQILSYWQNLSSLLL